MSINFADILLVLVTALYVFAYHYERNGNPGNWGQFFCRLFWGGAFGLGYVTLAFPHVNMALALLFGFLAFASDLIPHAAFQTMGGNSYPYNLAPGTSFSRYWPGFFLPRYTQAEWTALSQSKKTITDALGMLGVGVFTSLVLFAPTLYFGVSFGLLVAAAITAIGEPAAYLIGKLLPFNMWGNSPHSSQWGEFLIGVVRALAMMAFVTL